MKEVLKLKLFINNEWVDAEEGKTFTSYDPATGEAVAELALANKNDVYKAIDAAKAAADAGVWSGIGAAQREKFMLRAADILESRLEEFAQLESRDTGKNIRTARIVDIPYSIKAFRYHSKAATLIKGEVIPIHGRPMFDYVVYKPYGVAGVIAPFNYPLHLLTRGMCPALAAGNCVVIKASSLTPVTTQLLGEVIAEAGFPAGVVNIVSGPGDVVGRAIMSHPAVEVISFTGSEEVGRSLLEQSSKSKIMKKLVLELGGKSPIIVHKDADIDGAVQGCIWGFLLNKGEVCAATTRLFLHDNIYERFMEKLIAEVKTFRIGDPLCPQTDIGCLVSEGQLARVDKYVQEAVAEGATIAYGGKRYTEGVCAKGPYYMPTILTNVTNDFKSSREEIFGPVLSVIKFSDLDDAVRQANDTDFGLATAIFSEDVRTLFNVSDRLDAGTVWMNCTCFANIESPFGGNKNSGMGREDGTQGIMEYMKTTNHILYTGDYSKLGLGKG